MSNPILFNRRPSSEPSPPRNAYRWDIGPLVFEVFQGGTSGDFYWVMHYHDGHEFRFGPVSDQEPYETMELATHAAENSAVLLKLALESAARHPSQPPSPDA